MNVLILLWLCGHTFVQHSQGYVGQRCSKYFHWECEMNEDCWHDHCQCRYGYWEVGIHFNRKHCAAQPGDTCVYNKDCNQDESGVQKKCISPGVGLDHRCRCRRPYHLSRASEDYDIECKLDGGVYVGVGVAVVAAILIVWGVVSWRRRIKRRPQPQQRQPYQRQPPSPSPQPQYIVVCGFSPQAPHENGQIPNRTHHVYTNSELTAVSEAPPDYKTLFPQVN